MLSLSADVKGPAVFRCRAPYIKDLISMFGEPDGVVDKDVRSRAVFRVQEAEIWPETLAWLAAVPLDTTSELWAQRGLQGR